MSFLGDLFGGNPKQVGTQITRNEPPEYAKPYLEFGLEETRDLYDTPKQYYPDDTYVPFGDTTLEALGGMADRAREGSELVDSAKGFVGDVIGGNYNNPAGDMLSGVAGGNMTNAATDYVNAIAGGDFSGSAYDMLMDTARGNFLTQQNPYLDEALAPVRDRVTSQFAGSGRLGSGANIGAMTSALAPVYAQNFENERARQLQAINTLGGAQAGAQSLLGTLSSSDLNRQLNAMGQFGDVAQRDIANRFAAAGSAPGFAATDYSDLQSLLGVGTALDAKSGEQLASDIARFNFFENEPRERLADYLSMVSGGTVGSTSTRPIYGNPTATALGNLGTAAQGAYYASKAFPNFFANLGMG